MNFRSFDGLNFTIIFNPGTSTTNLKVPARVSAVLQDQALEKSITLRDKYNNMWPVRAGKVDDHWYLQEGWTNFLVDSLVTANDRLKFIFSGGEDLFDVKIIGSDGNLKKGVGYLKIDNSKEHQNIECDQIEDVDVLERASYGKYKNLKSNNNIKAISKLRKRGFTYLGDESDDNEREDDFAYDRCYLDGIGEDETKEVAKEWNKSKKNGVSEDDVMVRQRHMSKKSKGQSLSQVFSATSSLVTNETVDVNGYKVKATSAPILEAIFTKYGDIASNCIFKSESVRAFLLEVVCGVVTNLQNNCNDTILINLQTIEAEISDIQAAKVDVSWLTQHISKLKQISVYHKENPLLKSSKKNAGLVMNENLRARHLELELKKKRNVLKRRRNL